MQMSESKGLFKMKKNDKFDISNFISPDISHAPVYVWVWNDICSCEIIDNQLEEMLNLGIRAFYILPEPKEFRPDSMPTNLEPEYLSDEYFELCEYAFKKAQKLGMLCWIYDEGGWPSGGACGKVIKDHPEYAKQTLKAYEYNFSAGYIYKKTSKNVIATFVQDKEMICEGYIFAEDTAVTEYVIEKEGGNYPDLLNREATEYFIEITHKKYPLISNVTAVFTDEPKAPTNAFNNELADKYEVTYDESILPHLPLIMGRIEVTEENVHILHRWYDLCSKSFCDNFLLPCKKLANEKGLDFTGHLDKDHDPLGCILGGNNFNLMRALRCFDIPGIDVICRQIYPDNKVSKKDDMNGFNGFFPRYASSAAAQNGAKLAMSEIMGVSGTAVTYDIMRFTVGYLAVRGINIFNLFNFPLGRKDSLLAQELPVYTDKQPYYKHLNKFNLYMERLSYISSLGERVYETALYYPVSDFNGGMNSKTISERFDTLGRTLEDMMADFDIVDDDVIQSAENKDGCFRIGKAKYRHIIIPDGAYIPQKTQEALNCFIENGGRISNNISEISPVIVVDGKGLRAIHRKAENSEIFCLFRESGENGDYTIHLPSSNGYLLDLMNGNIQKLNICNGILNITLTVGETAVIMLTDEVFDAEDIKEFKEKTEIPNEFTFCKDAELTCNENGFENINHNDNPIPINLGDWSHYIGNDYSGSCIYETSFTLPDEKIGKDGEIDLGDVHFSASVCINDQSLGTVLIAPYRLKIPCGVLAKENKLKIVVTNTSANWYVHTDYFDKWSIKELSPYFETELEYAKDYASGGLYGPVTIYTE